MAINIPIVTGFDDRGVKLAEKRFAQFQKETSKIGQSIKSAFLPAAAAVAGLGAAAFGAAKAAIEDQQSSALLERQLQATTKATQAQVKATEDYITGLSLATGVADDELRPALAKIVRSTKDLTKSQKLLSISLDVAKGSGKSLAQVSESISRAYGGNVKALARLDPSLKKFIDKTTTADEAVAMLAKNFEGAAAKNADTFRGRMDRLNVALSEAYESIGYALLPILEKLVRAFQNNVLPYIEKVIKALEEQGLSGAVKTVSRDFGNFIMNADGWKGTIIDLTGAIIALSVAVKGLLIFNAVNGAASALAGTLSAIGTAVLPGLAIGAGTVLGVFASLFATVTAFVGLMRDTTGRSAFFEYLANVSKLIANGFILAHNAAVALLNLPLYAANLLPGVDVPTFATMDMYDFTFDTAPGGSRNNGGGLRENAQVQINVNGAIDPVSTARQIDSILRRGNRRGIITEFGTP
jgi:hypothetical protein